MRRVDGKLILTGTGTSQGVPVIGCTCEVCRSLDSRDKRLRTSCVIQLGPENIWIDPGPDFRLQALRLALPHLSSVLITHEHKDHTGGMDDLRSYNQLGGTDQILYAWPRVAHRIKQDYSYAFAKKKYPGAPSFDLREIRSEVVVMAMYPFEIFRSLHYKLPVLSMVFNQIAYVTDVNILSKKLLYKIENIDILILDCLQLTDHISHLNLEQVLELIDLVKPKRTILTHISHRLGLHSESKSFLPTNVEFGYDGMKITF